MTLIKKYLWLLIAIAANTLLHHDLDSSAGIPTAAAHPRHTGLPSPVADSLWVVDAHRRWTFNEGDIIRGCSNSWTRCIEGACLPHQIEPCSFVDCTCQQ